jgi:hypothetical protein
LTFKLLAAGLIQAFVVIPNILLIFLLTAHPIALYLLFLVIIVAFDTIDLLEILSFRVPENKTPITSTEKSQKSPEMYISFTFSMRIFSIDYYLFFSKFAQETGSEMKVLESPTT